MEAHATIRDIRRHQVRPLTEEETRKLHALRDIFWDNYADEGLCRIKMDRVLSDEEWGWLMGLVKASALYAEVAQGLTTPNPFVLCFDSTDEIAVMMVHPIHLPFSFALKVFNEASLSSATKPPPSS